MTTFRYVNRGDRIEIPTAEWHNALVDVIRQMQSTERGFQDNSGLHTKRFTQKGDVVDVVITEDLDEYSILAIDDDAEGYLGTGTLGTGAGETEQVSFDIIIPVAFSRKVRDADDSVFIVNHHTACAANNRYILPILGTHRPYLCHYDPDDGLPELGKPIGPKFGTYKVAVGYTGCLCVSAPDTVNELVWIVRAPGGGGAGLVELCALETASRSVPYTALLGTWNPAENSWCYVDAPTVYAIDHRVGPPYAEEGWKGMYQAMPSTQYGTIYDNVSLDCERPDEGCACSGTGS